MEEDKHYLESIKSKHCNFNFLITNRIYTLNPKFLSEENHVKMLLIDGQYFVMGGSGVHEKMGREVVPQENDKEESFGSKFIDKAFRDTDIIGYGEIAQTMRNQFFNLYGIWEHRMTGVNQDRYFANEPTRTKTCEIFHKEENLIRDCQLKYIVCGPEHRKKNPISHEIAALTDSAQNEIKIANLLFNPDRIIRNSLKRAKNRKIKIEGYLNGTSNSSSSVHHYIYALPNRYNYHLLTTSYEYHKKDQLYHKKVMTVDEKYTVVGSFNLGIKSSRCDYESVCVIDDPRIAHIMNQALAEDAKHSLILDQKKMTSNNLWNRIRGKIVILTLGNLFG